MLSILVSLFAMRWGWDPYFRGFATFKGIATQGRNTQGNLSLWHVATTDHSLEKGRAISSSNTSGRQIASCVREISQENLFPRQNFVAPRKVTQNHSANPLLNLCDLFVCLFFFLFQGLQIHKILRERETGWSWVCRRLSADCWSAVYWQTVDRFFWELFFNFSDCFLSMLFGMLPGTAKNIIVNWHVTLLNTVKFRK